MAENKDALRSVMKLVIPYTPIKLKPAIRQLGESVGAEFADVSGSDMAYGELVARLWQGKSFLLLEHDVLPTAALLEEMWQCPEQPWCAGFAWRYSGPVYYGEGETKPRHPIREKETALFCNKFSADLLRRTPAVVGAVRVRWTQVDFAILGTLRMYGAQPHLHEPAVQHLHATPPTWAATMTEDDWGRVDA